MKTVLCKITFISPTDPELILDIVGELDIDQVLSQQNEMVSVEARSFSENKLVTKHSVLHKADICQIQIFKEKKIYAFDKTSLRLMSQDPNFKGMKV